MGFVDNLGIQRTGFPWVNDLQLAGSANLNALGRPEAVMAAAQAANPGYFNAAPNPYGPGPGYLAAFYPGLAAANRLTAGAGGSPFLYQVGGSDRSYPPRQGGGADSIPLFDPRRRPDRLPFTGRGQIPQDYMPTPDEVRAYWRQKLGLDDKQTTRERLIDVLLSQATSVRPTGVGGMALRAILGAIAGWQARKERERRNAISGSGGPSAPPPGRAGGASGDLDNPVEPGAPAIGGAAPDGEEQFDPRAAAREISDAESAARFFRGDQSSGQFDDPRRRDAPTPAPPPEPDVRSEPEIPVYPDTPEYLDAFNVGDSTEEMIALAANRVPEDRQKALAVLASLFG